MMVGDTRDLLVSSPTLVHLNQPMTDALTVALDYRPALYPSFGIGRYVGNLVPALLEADPNLALRLYGVFLRGRKKRIAEHLFPPKARASFHSAPIPARWVSSLSRFLPISARTFTGSFDLFHDTDYAVTPVRNRPRIATLYDTAYLLEKGYVSPSQSEHMSRVVKQLIHGVHHIITISEFAKGELVEAFGLDPDRISVTYLGVDPLFHGEPGSGEVDELLAEIGLEPPYCLFLGTLEPRKNLVRLIRAFDRLLQAAPEYRLVIVGRKGDAHESVFDLVTALGIGERVQWLGALPDDQVFKILKGAEMLAYPSLYEGFGLPALEGMAAGIPVLSSDSHALKEVCGDGALLVNPRDECEMFEGLKTLALDRGEAVDIAERGRRRAREFTWSRCANQTLEAYRATLAKA